MSKVFIAVGTYNRKLQTEICLRQLMNNSYGHDVFIFDDASTEYDKKWLQQFSPLIYRLNQNQGIDVITALKMILFLENKEYDYLYITDNDAYVDPMWLNVAMDLHDKYGNPIGLFNSPWHWPFVVEEKEDVIIREVVAGISILMDRDFVDRYIKAIGKSNDHLKQYGILSPTTGKSFDWFMKEFTNGRCYISKKSYVEHFGAHGLHSDKGYETDLAQNKTEYLERKSSEIINYLKKHENE